jgi:hypothetical protein
MTEQLSNSFIDDLAKANATVAASAPAVIIIEPSLGTRRLDPKKSQPHSLDRDGTYNKPAMEWLLHALEKLENSGVSYVGSYHIEKVLENYSNLKLIYQKDRLNQGELVSTLLAMESSKNTIVARADVLYLPMFFHNLNSEQGMTFGNIRTSAGDQVTVAIRIKSTSFNQFVSTAKLLVKKNSFASFNDLQKAMVGGACEEIDLNELAAIITDRAKVSQTIFKGKAQTLEHIAPLAKEAQVLARKRFSVARWNDNAAKVVSSIKKTFPKGPVIVRSSATSEDQYGSSAAGAFDSVLDVDPTDGIQLNDAIQLVIHSFSRNDRIVSAMDEVLVQPQVQGLLSSGVLLTHDPRSGAPYLILNADENTGRSDLVTSGGKGHLKTYYALPGHDTSHLPQTVQKALRLGQEMMALSHTDALDIEYGIDRDNTCHLFQLRPLTRTKNLPIAEDDFLDVVSGAKDFVESLMRPRNNIVGTTSVLGSMPDWNPVEMLGETPNPLALSIYQSLIGDMSWSEARGSIGYKKIDTEALIVSVAGKPYVDVRASLNSFLPAGLEIAIAKKWIDANIERLCQHPHLHDKIEFEIAATCLAPDWPQHAARMRDAGLSKEQIGNFKMSLRDLTQKIVDGKVKPIDGLQVSLANLEERRHKVMNEPCETVSDIARRIRILLNDCRKYGIVPFSTLARYAFIAMALLRGLKDRGIIDEAECEKVLLAVPTVASSFSKDMSAYADGLLGLDKVIERYGHLRPHSYDITSPNYASDTDRYFNKQAPSTNVRDKQKLTAGKDIAEGLSAKAYDIEKCFRDLGLHIDYGQFIDFIKKAISARESAKFQFMRSLNDALENIALLGKKIGFDRDRLAFIPINEYLRLSTDSFSHAQSSYFRRMVEFNKKRMLITCAIRLPELIRTHNDVAAFEVIHDQPNFVSHKCIQARVVWLDEEKPPYNLEGAIVAIRSADPGYDWIFSYSVAGLLTQYGGIGSHMSIRAAEFGLPAAIGCGATLFESLYGCTEVEIDGRNGTVKKL